MEHTQQQNSQLTHPADKFVSTAEALERARANKGAREVVQQEYACKESKGPYRNVLVIKPDDSVWLMYENFSSLSVFSVGSIHHKKIRQINKLMSEYGVDILAGCKTRTDWHFVESEEDKYSNLFENGHPTREACGYNINNGKTKHDQWGGTCISAFGQLSSFVTAKGVDSTSLGWWSWLQVGGGGKAMQVITAYQPGRLNKNTHGGTV
jgi:hypothetical protein